MTDDTIIALTLAEWAKKASEAPYATRIEIFAGHLVVEAFAAGATLAAQEVIHFSELAGVRAGATFLVESAIAKVNRRMNDHIRGRGRG